MHHSMNSNNTCYALDIIDDYVSSFVLDTWIWDELSKLLDEKEPFDGVVEEIHHQGNIEDHERALQLVSHRTSQNKKRWKNFATIKKTKSPTTTPKSCMYPLVLSEGRFC